MIKMERRLTEGALFRAGASELVTGLEGLCPPCWLGRRPKWHSSTLCGALPSRRGRKLSAGPRSDEVPLFGCSLGLSLGQGAQLQRGNKSGKLWPPSHQSQG
ncbi:hypothetical protein DPEC_G00250180 [Dallia pectoralis]|uniref:Uncharacterized protein n=1 Tax=Dallia pectoralis TaxID=75939 RepID=A0ACC2FTE5_DALPE|nr:hypothetical protein DPEC_G00250180 [Dallia pectoralis]